MSKLNQCNCVAPTLGSSTQFSVYSKPTTTGSSTLQAVRVHAHSVTVSRKPIASSSDNLNTLPPPQLAYADGFQMRKFAELEFKALHETLNKGVTSAGRNTTSLHSSGRLRMEPNSTMKDVSTILTAEIVRCYALQHFMYTFLVVCARVFFTGILCGQL